MPRSKDTPPTEPRKTPIVVALPVMPLARLATLWGVSTRQCADALRAHHVPVERAKGTEVVLVRLADLESLFASSAREGEATLDTVLRVVSDKPVTADAVLADLGLRRRKS